ncbi:MAG: protein tyrosine phosphatase family protein [Pirellulales bacterium]
MNQVIQIDDAISVGGQLNTNQLKQLADDSFKTIINLQTDGETNQLLSPEAECRKVRDLGMQYVHFPVSLVTMSPDKVDEFRQRLKKWPTPVFVHCSSGKRAGAFVMMDKAVRQGWTGEDTLAKAARMGFECDVAEIKEFVKYYVNSRRP